MFNWVSGSGGSRKDGGGGSRRDKGKAIGQYITKKELEKKLNENRAPADTLETCTQKAIDAILTELTEKKHGFKDIKYDNRDEWDFINEQMKKFLREKFGAQGFFLEKDEHGDSKEGKLRIYSHAATVKRTTLFRTWYGTQKQIDQALFFFARAHASSSNQPSHAPAPAGRGRSRPFHGPEPAGHVSNLPSHASIPGNIAETDVNIGRLMRFEEMFGPR